MISVCMATYNGEKYIHQQIESIIKQLPDNAEIIVSDDDSKDKTLDIVRAFNDQRIKIISGPKKGVVKNFENALNNASGTIIFLSDQDDIWADGKVDKIISTFEDKKIQCILHDATVVDADENVIMQSFFAWRKVCHGVVANLIKNSYTGCCMAFRKEFADRCIPFPENIEMHDWWLGLNAEKEKSTVFLKEKLIMYRRHGENTNSLEGYPLMRKLRNRITLLKAII